MKHLGYEYCDIGCKHATALTRERLEAAIRHIYEDNPSVGYWPTPYPVPDYATDAAYQLTPDEAPIRRITDA